MNILRTKDMVETLGMKARKIQLLSDNDPIFPNRHMAEGRFAWKEEEVMAWKNMSKLKSMRLKNKSRKELIQKTTFEMIFNSHISEILLSNGIKTVEQLTSRTKDEIRSIDGIGRSRLRLIMAGLNKNNLRLKG